MRYPLIDSHAHLTFDRFDGDRDAVLDRMSAAGVEAAITIGTDVDSSTAAAALADGDARLFASAGIHPHQADAFDDARWGALEALWSRDRVVAVGETGLDYYYDYSDRKRQQRLFRRHLEAAKQRDMPVVIHIRDAFDDAFRIMGEVGARGVVHCFTGGPEECRIALDLGFYISLSGIVTFKSAKALRSAVPGVPDDRLLVETDAPFLAPTPHRGKRNEPAYVVRTAEEVAALRGQDFAHVCAISRANTQRLFGLPT